MAIFNVGPVKQLVEQAGTFYLVYTSLKVDNGILFTPLGSPGGRGPLPAGVNETLLPGMPGKVLKGAVEVARNIKVSAASSIKMVSWLAASASGEPKPLPLEAESTGLTIQTNFVTALPAVPLPTGKSVQLMFGVYLYASAGIRT